MSQESEKSVRAKIPDARPINGDQVSWMLNAIGRYLPRPNGHPAVSRFREMQEYALLYELMEVANLYFEDAAAQHNGTPNDVRRFQYASKRAEMESHANACQGMGIADNSAAELGQLMREQAQSPLRGGPAPHA